MKRAYGHAAVFSEVSDSSDDYDDLIDDVPLDDDIVLQEIELHNFYVFEERMELLRYQDQMTPCEYLTLFNAIPSYRPQPVPEWLHRNNQ